MFNKFNYFISYNDTTNLDKFCRISARPSKPIPEKIYEEIDVPGGERLYIEKGYAPIEISVEMNFISQKSSLWDDQWRDVKRWLHSKGNKKLQFCDDLKGYYIVSKVTVDSLERVYRRGGKFTVVFTCQPYFYIADEEIQIISNVPLFNDYDLESRPIYRVVGNGQLTVNVNGKDIKVNVGQETTIDTQRGRTYREGIVHNTSLTANYKDLYLKPGDNTFVWTGDFQIYVEPKWRVI